MIFIGTQGWNYDGWEGAFYPPKSSKKELLGLYSRVFDTVEIDSSFYAIPAASAVTGWYEKTPAGFQFSLKLPSEITHKNRLRDSEKILEEFAGRARLLKEKLGSVLIQLPPDFSPTEQTALRAFLKILPADIRFAIEFRDRKWISRALLEDVEEHQAAVALVDGKWIDREISFRLIEHQRADFSYLRWMGVRELTDFSRLQIDRSKELAQWAEAFSRLRQQSQKIFGYFNNHFQGHSPVSANAFKSLLGLPTVSPAELIIQPSLF